MIQGLFFNRLVCLQVEQEERKARQIEEGQEGKEESEIVKIVERLAKDDRVNPEVPRPSNLCCAESEQDIPAIITLMANGNRVLQAALLLYLEVSIA